MQNNQNSKNKTTIIIPNFNGRVFLMECLSSLRKQTLESFGSILVDNGSNDESVEFVRVNYPEVEVVELKENKGFAAAVNEGIKRMESEYVVVLNNDTIQEANWLRNLVETADKHPEFSFFASKVLQMEDKSKIDSTGEVYTWWGMPYPRGRDEIDKGQYNKSTEIFGATGNGTLYRKSMLDKIGLFDEEFFAYYEDVDLSFRAQLAGFKCMFVPSAVIYHKMGATSDKMSNFSLYHSLKNGYYLFLKNTPFPLIIVKFPKFFLGQLLRATSTIKKGHPVVLLKAYFRVLVKLPHVFMERRKIMKTKSVSNKYINKIVEEQFPPILKNRIQKRFS